MEHCCCRDSNDVPSWWLLLRAEGRIRGAGRAYGAHGACGKAVAGTGRARGHGAGGSAERPGTSHATPSIAPGTANKARKRSLRRAARRRGWPWRLRRPAQQGYQWPRWTSSSRLLRSLARAGGKGSDAGSGWPMAMAPIGVHWSGTPNCMRKSACLASAGSTAWHPADGPRTAATSGSRSGCGGAGGRAGPGPVPRAARRGRWRPAVTARCAPRPARLDPGTCG